jgi:hypothetical protein
MAQNTTDDGSDTIDLTNEMATVSFEVRSNNETERWYPESGNAEYGIVSHRYEGFPARGVVRYDVVGYEIVDMDFKPMDEDATMQEEFEYYEGEIRDWIEDALFNTALSSADANVYREGTHTVEIKNPYEGDRYTIKLETENKRRVR